MSEIENRIAKNFKKLKPWAEKNKIEAYRLYDRDIPAYPYMIDRYGDFILINDRRETVDFESHKLPLFEETKVAVKKLFSPKEIIVKERRRLRAGGEKSDQYEKIESRNERIVVGETQAKFYVNLHDYLDTGLFLDHRRVRQMIFDNAKPGSQFLNLFSYTGSGSVFAALKGALTTSVDLSATYTEWAKDNFSLNKLSLDGHRFVNQGVKEYLRDCEKQFDLIFLDPPTFSNSKKTDTDFEVERDQDDLLNVTMSLLKDDGKLIFSTNKRSFRLSQKIQSAYNVKEVSRDTLPMDFHDAKIRQVFVLTALKS